GRNYRGSTVFSAYEAELSRTVRRLAAGAAVELGQDVAHVHLDGPGAEEELARDLPVRAAHGDEAHDLELAPRQPAVLDLLGARARDAAVGLLAERVECGGRLVGERTSPKLARDPIRARQPLDR